GMDTPGQAQEKGERKRKLKFSEQELEVLTEESAKRRLWVDIQSKICAIGVAQRSTEEIKKRWYETDTHMASDSNTSGSFNIVTVR
ncbi:hypothetical protein NDU88_005152, partial [Pleurodeles waltl]